MEPDRFSDWNQLCHVTAWVYRFLENCKTKETKRTGPLEFDEILDAQTTHTRKAQIDSFPDEISELIAKKRVKSNSKIAVLYPSLDQDRIIRANSRIKNADFLNYNTKYPIILPKNHKITELIVKDCHEDGNHERGTNGTLADLSIKYWLIAGREQIRSWESRCNECKRRKAKAASQIMSPLPPCRLGQTMKAFDKCGLDYGGPFLTKCGRGKPRNKRYLCLFTCMATRAVHLEMAYSLDTSSFLNAFWRMTYRRGLPSEIVSDNGKNFVAGEKELRSLTNNLNKNDICKKTSDKGVKWHFNPPYSPHHGGAFESLIKTAKKAMYSQMKDAEVTDEELVTIIAGAESLINSRPLTYQSANGKDLIPLTPNHFLHGQIGGALAPEVDDWNQNPIKRWRRVQEILKHFWKRWIREWLPSIGKRSKWYIEKENLKVDDVVLVMTPDTKRGKWPLGRIVETVKGIDNKIRTVKLMMNGKIFERGLNTIYPLNQISAMYSNQL